MLLSSTLVLLMDTLINFIVDNWQWCSSLLVSIISFILLLIFKKRPKYYGYYLDILNKVNQAENLFPGEGRGKEKLDFVVASICQSHDMAVNAFNKEAISFAVDKCMSTPKKKGDQKGEKKNEK